MLGHAKTVLVLIMGWAFLGELISPLKLTGMVMAVAGMILYSYFAVVEADAACTLPLSKRDKAADGGMQVPLLKE